MPVVSKQEFLQNLVDSGVGTSELLTLWTANVSKDATAIQLAKSLVDNNHLTEWQAKFLLSGQKKLKFGNYMLEQRIERSDIGDSFVAMQLKLERRVKVMFLNKSLSAKLSKRKGLLRIVASTATIEHDSIEHVHVIDQAGGRYMLITDFIEAPTLNAPDLISELEADDLSRLLTQIFETVSIIHKHGLSHGALSEADFIVGARRKLTLKNIAASFLVHNAAVDTPELLNNADADTLAVTKIARKLTRRLGKEDDDRIPQVVAMIDQLESQQINLDQAGTRIKELYPSATLPRFRKHSTVPADNVHEIVESRKEVEAAAAEPYPEDSDPIHFEGERSGVWYRRIMQTAGALSAIGLIVYLATSGWFGGGDADADNDRGRNRSASNEQQELPSLASMSDMPERKTNDGQQSNQAEPIGLNLEKQRKFGSSEFPSTDSNGKQSKKQVADDEVIAKETEPSDETAIVESGPSSSSDSLLSAFESLNSNTTDQVIAGSDESDLAVPKGSDSNSDSDSAPPSAQVNSIPTSVDLPAVDSGNMLALASLSVDRIDLELISDATTSKSKAYFELTGNQAFDWSVNIRVGKNSSPVSVGNIAIGKDNLLKFSWNPEAADQKEAPFLANSILKVSDGLTTNYIQLRKPVSIEGFLLKRDQPQVRVDLTDVKYLPANAKVELGPLDEKEFGATFMGEREDNSFSRKNPLFLNFRELPEYQLLFIWLAADLKNRTRLEASLQLQLDPEDRSRLATEKSLETAKEYLDNYLSEVKQNHDYLSKVKIDEHRKRYNLSSEQYKQPQRLADVKKLKQQMELSETRFETFREIQTQLESFYDKPLPVTLYFEVQDQRVVLATTVTE